MLFHAKIKENLARHPALSHLSVFTLGLKKTLEPSPNLVRQIDGVTTRGVVRDHQRCIQSHIQRHDRRAHHHQRVRVMDLHRSHRRHRQDHQHRHRQEHQLVRVLNLREDRLRM